MVCTGIDFPSPTRRHKVADSIVYITALVAILDNMWKDAVVG